MVSLNPVFEGLVAEQHRTPEQPDASESSHLRQTSLGNQVHRIDEGGHDDLQQIDDDSALGLEDTG